MALKTQYFSIDGEVLAESGSNGYLSYTRDNIGSVVSTHALDGSVVNAYQYKPFGELWKATGTGAQSRRFLWCGSWGLDLG